MKRQRKSKRSGKRDRKPYRGRRKRQMGGFLNRYDLAYASRDTVNQAAKVSPGVIKNASNEINNIGKDRISQIITQVRKEVDQVLPKMLRAAIDDVYQDVCQTPFRMLRNFGKQQLNKPKRKY